MIKKYIPALLMIIAFFASCTTNNPNNEYNQTVYLAPGVGLGTIVAIVLSWSRNKSIIWAIVHGIFGWFYVIYAVIVGKK